MTDNFAPPNSQDIPLDDFSAAMAALDPSRVLVVDDVKENLFLIEYMFKQTDLQVSLASSAEEALEKARREHPILVISDVEMPGMSGFDLLEALKADPQTRDTAVILVTGYHRTSKQVVEGLRRGADDYIYRPYVRDEFMSRVEAVLRAKRAEVARHRQAQLLARQNRGLALVNGLSVELNTASSLEGMLDIAALKMTRIADLEAAALLAFDINNRYLMMRLGFPSASTAGTVFEVSTALGAVENLPKQAVDLVFGYLDQHPELIPHLSPEDRSAAQIHPLQTNDQLLGAVVVIPRHHAPLSEYDRALVLSAVQVIAVTLENRQLLQNAQDLVDNLIVLNEVARSLTSSLDLQQILNQTTTLVNQALRSDAMSLWFLDETGQTLEVAAASGIGAEALVGYQLPVEVGIAGFVARTGQTYLSPDVTRDERHFPEVARRVGYQPHSLVCLPVTVKGRTIGVMQVMHQEVDRFTPEDVRLFSTIASTIGVAVENARLFGQLQDFNHHLEQMVRERTQDVQEEAEKVQAILSSMADGVLVTDAEGRLVTANAAAEELLGFRWSDVAYQPVSRSGLTHPVWEHVEQMIRRPDQPGSIVVEFPSPADDSPQVINARAAPIRLNHDIIGVVIVLRDITALKEVERMKARFIAGVTHELKTPLSIIKLHVENLLAYYDRLPTEKQMELLRTVQNQTGLLDRLIDDVLTLSRLDTVQEAQWTTVNLPELVGGVVEELRALAQARNLTLTWQAPEELPVPVIPDQLERAMRNLVDNAIKYTPAGGEIQVAVRQKIADDQPRVRIEVRDTGIGISPEHQQRIFDHFYRIDTSHTTPGTGLGLSIVREIVNAHRGSLHVESTPGAGSVFTILLPLPAPADTERAEQ